MKNSLQRQDLCGGFYYRETGRVWEIRIHHRGTSQSSALGKREPEEVVGSSRAGISDGCGLTYGADT